MLSEHDYRVIITLICTTANMKVNGESYCNRDILIKSIENIYGTLPKEEDENNG